MKKDGRMRKMRWFKAYNSSKRQKRSEEVGIRCDEVLEGKERRLVLERVPGRGQAEQRGVRRERKRRFTPGAP